MMNSKRILAMVLALVMVFSMLPMSAGAEEVPAFSITSATGKAGEEVTVAVTIENNPGVMMYNYGIQYDTTRLERVEMTKGGMDNVGIWTIQDKVLWENNDFTNSYYNGDTVVVKFKIKEDAPAGDAEISISDFMALDYEGNLVEYTLKAGKITVEEKLETLIPFTKANHTDSGAAIHDKYTGVVGLKVEGIKMADWTEWQQGFNYQNQSITIFVDAASKDDAATLSLILAEGQTGSGSIIETPATVQLTDGAGSFTASYMTIGTGGLAPKLHIPITFKLACAEHSFADATCNAPKTCTVCGITEGEADASAHQWNNATCTTAKTCSVCGATDGEADPDAHNYVDGVCEYCGKAEAAATYEVKIYGYSNDVYYVVTGKDENGSDILGNKLVRTENEDGSITLTVPADVTRIAIYEEPYIYGFGVSPENNEVTIDYVEISIKTPDGGACTTADMTVTDSEGYNQPPFDYESDGMWSISAVIGREYTFTVTAPGYKTAVVKKTFDASEHNYQSFDITLEAEAQEPEKPEFDGVTVDLKELTALDRYNTYYFTITAGKDLKVILTDNQAVQQVGNMGDMSGSDQIAYTSDEGGVFVVTAEELERCFVSDEVRGYIPERWGDILQSETSGVVLMSPFNSNSYTVIVEVLPAETQEPEEPEEPEGYAIPITGGHLKNYIANIYVSGAEVVGTPTYALGYMHLSETITVQVSAATKDNTATIAYDVVKSEGLTGSVEAFTVALNNGVGSAEKTFTLADGKQITLTINFEIAPCTEHSWNDATCTTAKTCSVCGATEGSALGHNYVDGVCSNCGEEESFPITFTVDGTEMKPVSAGEVTCPWNDTATKLVLTVPSGSESITLTSDVYMDVYGDKNDEEDTWISNDTGYAATVNIADGYVYFCIMMDEETFHLYIEEAEAGYTVTMSEDVEAVVGGDVSIPVTVGHTDNVTSYNAFDFTFTYDPAVLELTSTQIEGMTVTDNNGTVHVERYGTDLNVGDAALTLTFKAIANGQTNVKVTAAKVDISESALTEDAPDASVLDNVTLVTITGYTVTLHEDFEGESTVLPGEDYTFTAKDQNYDYTVKATIDGNEIEVTDNGDGSYTIVADEITGNIVITSTKEGKKFDVTLTEDIEGEKQAQYMTDYTATLKKEEGCSYDVTVKIDGHEFTNFQYDAATGVITIPGESITGAISIDSGKEELPAQTYTVEFDGDGAGEANGEKTVKEGDDYTFTINNIAGVSYNVSYVMGDAEAVELTPSNGTYTIANVTGDLVITIKKISDLEVEVTEYVTLDGKTMFLVTATQTLADDEVLSYDGTVMFWSEQYKAWAYLVITEGTLQVEDAKAAITHSVAAKTTLTQTYDVNATNKVDINDAQLVFDMYNNVYQNFDSATMLKFLKADVNGSKSVNSQDAIAIVSEILKAK